MDRHTFDASRADRLERTERGYHFLSAEERFWALDLTPTDSVVDLGSRTGFYTDDVTPNAGAVYAVDVQEPMHDHHRVKGVVETRDD